MDEHPVKIAFDQLKPVGETISWGALIGSLIGWLPTVATLLTVLWYGVLFYDRYMMKKRNRSDDGTDY